MADYSLVPVNYKPDFENVSLVPVPYNPFDDNGTVQQAQVQPQPAQARIQQPQSPATRDDLPDIGPPPIGDGGQFSAGTAFGNKAADVASKVAYGMMGQLATLPQRAIDASAADVQHLGQDGYTPQSIGPAVETTLMMAGPGSPRAERGTAGALGGKLPPPESAASVADKLERYLLNPDHADGGPKANWFKQALGFTRENAADLAKQLVFDESQAVQRGVNEYGTHFNQTINVTGANGRTIPVTTGWTVGPDGVPRLVTAFLE